MNSILQQIFETKKPLVYLHMHEVSDATLQRAIDAGGTIEIDLSVDDKGKPFIGHHPSFYAHRKQKSHNNLPLNQVIDRVQSTDLIVVIDCKDVGAIEHAYTIIERLGPSRVVVHGWVDALQFKPYNSSLEIEPQWIHEDLPLEELRDLYQRTNASLILSSRGLSSTYIQNNYDVVLGRIAEVASSLGAAVNLNMPYGDAQPKVLVDELLEQKILTFYNVDAVGGADLPTMYIGMTDQVGRQQTTGLGRL